MAKVYCHACGKDFDGKDGQRVCAHITVGGTEAMHKQDEIDRKKIAEKSAKSLSTEDTSS